MLKSPAERPLNMLQSVYNNYDKYRSKQMHSLLSLTDRFASSLQWRRGGSERGHPQVGYKVPHRNLSIAGTLTLLERSQATPSTGQRFPLHTPLKVPNVREPYLSKMEP